MKDKAAIYNKKLEIAHTYIGWIGGRWHTRQLQQRWIRVAR